MRDYESWSFRDRSFHWAIGASVLWHLFWFYAIQIDVSPKKSKNPNSPVIVSIAPVLDDTIFRTLVETKPSFSETFYRRISDFDDPVDVEVSKMPRYSSGDVVSVTLGQKVMNSLREWVGGSKISPDYEFSSRLKLGYSEGFPEIEGDVRQRQVIHRPQEPRITTAQATEDTELLFTVDPSGIVSAVEVLSTSGDADADAQWAAYLKAWQFAPLGIDKAPVQQRGKIRMRTTDGGRG